MRQLGSKRVTNFIYKGYSVIFKEGKSEDVNFLHAHVRNMISAVSLPVMSALTDLSTEKVDRLENIHS